MTCPKCACERSKVLETRSNVDHVERVRRCTNDDCGHVFKTEERCTNDDCGHVFKTEERCKEEPKQGSTGA